MEEKWNRSKWRKGKYEKFGADLDKEYSQKLKKAIAEDIRYNSIADWIRERGDKYLKEKEKLKNF